MQEEQQQQQKVQQIDKIIENCGKLEQIGKSNNSVIYSLLSKDGQPLNRVLKLVMHNGPNQHSKECEHLHNEANILKQLRHPSIIRNHSDIMSNQCIKNSHFCALQLELAETDFFDKIAKMYPNPVEPKYIRSAFAQIISGLDHMHSDINIAHNDIKLENIFLFKNKVKIADFGFASSVAQNKNIVEQYNAWKNRCKTPLAPEIIQFISQQQQCFDEKASDMFALGVSLFQSLFLRAPFFSKDYAHPQDSAYQYFFKNEKQLFWENEELQSTLKYLNQFEDFRQEQFIDLINNLLEVDPKKRLTIKQIQKHPWFKQTNNQNPANNLSSCTQF